MLQLQPTKRYTLGKRQRLKSRKLIDQLFRAGNSFNFFPVRVVWQYQQNSAATLQAGFTVSTRHFKKAVDRNRIKRLMREAYRLQKNDLQDDIENSGHQLAVFLIYVGKEIPDYLLITEKVKSTLNRLQKLVHEENTRNT